MWREKLANFCMCCSSKEHGNITSARDYTLALMGFAGATFGYGFALSYWTKWNRIGDSDYGYYAYTICSDTNLTHELSKAGIPCPDIVMEEFYEWVLLVSSTISTLIFLAVHFVEISKLKYIDFAYNLTAAVAFIIAGVMLIVSTLQIEILYDYLAPGFTQQESFMRGWKIAAGTLAFPVSIAYIITAYYIWMKGDKVPEPFESCVANIEAVP